MKTYENIECRTIDFTRHPFRIVSAIHDMTLRCEFVGKLANDISGFWMVPKENVSVVRMGSHELVYLIRTDVMLPRKDCSNVVSHYESDQSCSLCCTPKDMRTFDPCAHRICCNTCSKDFKTCPLCRRDLI